MFGTLPGKKSSEDYKKAFSTFIILFLFNFVFETINARSESNIFVVSMLMALS
jgi:hypothetical protein